MPWNSCVLFKEENIGLPVANSTSKQPGRESEEQSEVESKHGKDSAQIRSEARLSMQSASRGVRAELTQAPHINLLIEFDSEHNLRRSIIQRLHFEILVVCLSFVQGHGVAKIDLGEQREREKTHSSR